MMKKNFGIMLIAAWFIHGCTAAPLPKYTPGITVNEYNNATWERKEGYVYGVIDAIGYFSEHGFPPPYMVNCLFDPEGVAPPSSIFLIPATVEAKRVPKDKADRISPVGSLMKWVNDVCNYQEYGRVDPSAIDEDE